MTRRLSERGAGRRDGPIAGERHFIGLRARTPEPGVPPGYQSEHFERITLNLVFTEPKGASLPEADLSTWFRLASKLRLRWEGEKAQERGRGPDETDKLE